MLYLGHSRSPLRPWSWMCGLLVRKLSIGEMKVFAPRCIASKGCPMLQEGPHQRLCPVLTAGVPGLQSLSRGGGGGDDPTQAKASF